MEIAANQQDPLDFKVVGVNNPADKHCQGEDLGTLAGKLLTVQDEERRRIARDLHDDVNQRLGAMGLHLAALSRNLPASPNAVRRRIRSIRRHVSELSDEVRDLA